MEYSWEEYLNLKQQHDKDFNCQQNINAADIEGSLKLVEEQLKKCAVVTYTRPILTFDAFKLDINFFNYLIRERKDIIFSFYPEIGFAFFNNETDKTKFDSNKEFSGLELRCFKHLDLFENCVVCTRADNTTYEIWFDKVKLNNTHEDE